MLKRKSGFYISRMIALERGLILTAMIMAAIVVFMSDKDFFKAASRAIIGSLLFFGIIHAYKITDRGIVNVLGVNTSPYFSIGYVVMGGAFFLTGLMMKNTAKTK